MVALYCFYQIRCFDIWLHIKTGRWIWSNLRIPYEQLYSFSLGRSAWLNHSWLFQLVLYPFYKLMGINGIILVRALGILCVYSILLKVFLKSRKYFLLSFISICIAMFISRARFIARPELFTMLAILLVLYILRFHAKDKFIYILIPLQILWTNIHGYFILGPIIVVLFLMAQLCENKLSLPFEWNSNHIDRLYLRRVLLIFLAMIAVSFINPYGIKLLLYPIRVVLNGLGNISNRGYIFKDITELKPIAVHEILTSYRYFLLHIQIIVFALSLLLNIRRARLFDVLIFSIFLGLALNSNRHVAIFALSAGFLSLCNFVSAERHKFLDMFPIREAVRKAIYISIVIVASLFTAWLVKESAVYFYRLIPYKYIIDSKGNTTRLFFNNKVSEFADSDPASEFVLKNKIEGDVFNYINNASYLIFKLYPKNKIFIDARTELYTDRGYQQYFSMLKDPEIFEARANEKGINIVLLPCSESKTMTGFFKYLYKSKSWELVFFDGNSFIFLRKIKKFRKIISDNKYDIRSFNIEIDDEKAAHIAKNNYNISFLIRLAGFFINIDEPNKALKILNIAQKASKSKFEVHNLKAVALIKLKRNSEALNEFQRAYTIDPSNINMLKNMAVFYSSQHMPYAAIECLEQALEVNPDNAEISAMHDSIAKATNKSKEE